MLIKNFIFSLLILFSFCSAIKSSPKDNIQPDSVHIKKLIDNIHNFEITFYNSDKIDSSDFKEGIKNFNNLIGLFISLDSQYPDSNFNNKAFVYLEKKKNLEILNLYKTSSQQLGINNRANKTFRISMLKDSSKISDTGKNLLFFMKQPVDVSDLQKNFLNDHEAIVDFWIQKNKIFVFILTEDSLQLVNWDIPVDQVKVKINKLISPFYNNIDLLQLEFNTKVTFQLYNYLFQPLVENIQNYKEIYIIPDDFLIGFPFELLVTDTTIYEKQNHKIYYHHYSYLDFLIKKYAISYNYSTAYFAMVKGLDRTTKKLGRRLLTMSEPIIPQNMSELSCQLETFPIHDLVNSDYSNDEIRRVSRLLFRHDNLKQEQVTKTYLFENGRTYRWLYFALPGILDNLNPMDSGLLFSTNKNDSLFMSNWLSAHESIQFNLAADLLSLSATKLRSFDSDKNPGVIALPQAFLCSGVKSVLYSLWRINSISTSQFMSKFYWELKYKRQTNARALQEAKIASMKDTFTFSGKEISRAHPYFWATFQLIGDPKIRPPSPTKIPPWGVVIIVYVMVFMISLYITRKTLPER